jgi:MFS family permease
VLASLLVGDAIYGFQQTAITPALPVVGEAFDASREWTTWVFSGYLIVASVMPIFLGKAADRMGKRRVYLTSLAVFWLGSVIAAAAPSIEVVVIGRLVQGVGGIVFPLSFSMLRDHLPAHRVGTGIGIMTGGFGLGALAGFGVGGAITQFLSWRWVFGVGAIVLLAAIALVRLVVPADSPRSTAGLDTPGAVLLGAAVATLIVAITEGPQRGWTAPFVVAMFVVSILAAAGWVVRELATPEPLMDLRVLASRTVLMVNVASLLGGFAVFSVNILLPFLLEGSGAGAAPTAFGLVAGPLLTGVVLLPRALGQSIGGPATGPLSRLLGTAPAFAFGLLVQAGSTVALALSRGSVWMLLAELGGLGLGFGITLSAAGGIVTLAATTTETSIATSLNSVVRRVGGGVGAQIAAALISTITLAGSDTPAPTGFTIAFLLAAAVSVAGAGCALLAVPLRALHSA